MSSFLSHPAAVTAHAVPAATRDRLLAVCSVTSYALVALLLRLVAARDFFLAGQTNVAGPRYRLSFQGFDYALILPAQLHDEALSLFATKFANLPLPSNLVAYGLTYAEFLLPICLVVGFATRFAALLLLVVTLLLQIYVAPEALWTAHIYWIAILLVLMTCGGGVLSLDRLIRHLYHKA